MKKIYLLILLNIFAFGIVSAQKIIIVPNTEAKKAAPTEMTELIGLQGKTAPSFAGQSMNGTDYNLEKLRGKIVVINLWGTFCAPCLAEMPGLNSLTEKYKNQEVVFLAPAPDDKAVLETFLKKNLFQYQVIPNAFAVIEDYAPHKKSDDPNKKDGFIMLLPTHLIIDKNGVVVYHEWGFRKNTVEKLSAEIDQLLKDQNAK